MKKSIYTAIRNSDFNGMQQSVLDQAYGEAIRLQYGRAINGMHRITAPRVRYSNVPYWKSNI